jgi:hypothetical protein
MKLAVMGSSGYEAIAASPASGAEIMTGEEPAEALAGAQVVADVREFCFGAERGLQPPRSLCSLKSLACRPSLRR